MQVDNKIADLFNGFDSEFSAGDWNAIASDVLRDNKKHRYKKLRFNILSSLGLAASILLGVIHFSTISSSVDEVSSNPQSKKDIVAQTHSGVQKDSPLNNKTEETHLPSPAPKLIAIAPITKEEQNTNETKPEEKIATSNNPPIKEMSKVALPHFTLARSEYCIGEQLDFIANFSADDKMRVEVNGTELSLDELKKYRLFNSGEANLTVLKGEKIVLNKKIITHSVNADINYKKDSDLENPFVHFRPSKLTVGVNYSWYVNNGLVSNQAKFKHIFASKGYYSVKMVAKNTIGCKDSVIKKVRILRGYNLMATTIFNPNKGKWLPLGLKKEGLKFELKILNKDGEVVFVSNSPIKEWNGEIEENTNAKNGELYYWLAKVEDANGRISEYGNSLLINLTLN